MQNESLNVTDILNDPRKHFPNIFDLNDEQETEIEFGDCNYFTETELKQFYDSKGIKDSNNLKIISLNIANILSKLNNFKVFIKNISTEKNKPGLIFITETHLNPSLNHGYGADELKNILPGYKFYHKDRKNRKGGGTGVFIMDELTEKVEIIRDVPFIDEVFETISIKIPDMINASTSGHGRDLILISIYRQPGNENIKEFLNQLRTWLSKWDKRSNEIIITGDMNLDLLKYESHSHTSDYLDLMLSHKLLPRILRPTRIKHQSASLIDHIFTKGENFHSGILLTEIAGSYGYTDHLPSFCIIPINPSSKPNKVVFSYSFFTSEGHTKRREGLRSENWQDIYNKNDPNTIYNLLLHKYCKHYNNSITTKTSEGRRNKFSRDPWMTKDILRDMKKRDRLAKRRDRREDYKTLRNDIVRRVRKAEREHNNKKINDNWNNIKEQWKVLNKVMGKQNDKTNVTSIFKHNDLWITDDTINANNMNKYYAQVGPSTNASVGHSVKNAKFYLEKHQERNTHSLPSARFHERDIIEIIKKLRPKKSHDDSGLQQAIVLNDVELITGPITHLLNCSLSAGLFPDKAKVARVIPVYKNKGDKQCYSNYRPISLLPTFSKIMEKLIYDKLFRFLVRYQILFKSQYGFRSGHNTTHASLDFLSTIEEAFENNEFAIGIFCDLSKAFDTLDHQILLNKLEHYGIRGQWLLWFESYLSNRSQFVELNGTPSTYEAISVGVPQGSILGPLLFLIYINDLPASLDKLRAVMFADDTNLIIRGQNLAELTSTLNAELSSLNDYFKANKLKLNVDKTKMVCFRPKNLNFQKTDLVISLNNIQLTCESSITFLGLTLDEHLSWENHCNKVANKISQNKGVLKRVNKQLPFPSLLTLYNSLILPHITYGLEIWGRCSIKASDRITKIQKECVRILFRAFWRSHTEPRMKKIGILNFKDLYYYLCLNMTYDIVKGCCPTTLKDSFEHISDTHTYGLRSRFTNPQDLVVSLSKVKQVRDNFFNVSPKLWNDIPDEIKNAKSRNIFKKMLKKYLLDKYEWKVNCNNPNCTDTRFHSV